MNKKIAILTMALCLAASTAFADMSRANKIFDNYDYGMNRERVMKQFTTDELKGSDTASNSIVVVPKKFAVEHVNANVSQITFVFDDKNKLNGCTFEYKGVKINPLEKDNVISQMERQLERTYGSDYDKDNKDGANYMLWYNKYRRLSYICTPVEKDTYDLTVKFESREK